MFVQGNDLFKAVLYFDASSCVNMIKDQKVILNEHYDSQILLNVNYLWTRAITFAV